MENENRGSLFIDELTQLPNKRKLDEECARMSNGNIIKGVVHINIAHFKKLNDAFGYGTADEVLAKLAECLRKHLSRDNFTAYRLGGDVFRVLAFRDDMEYNFMRINKFKRDFESICFKSSESVGVSWDKFGVDLNIAYVYDVKCYNIANAWIDVLFTGQRSCSDSFFVVSKCSNYSVGRPTGNEFMITRAD